MRLIFLGGLCLVRLFFVALQFLTRLHFVKQDNWTAEDFGRSTRFFPLVGLVLGCIYMAAAFLLLNYLGPSAITGTLLLIMTIALTGGLHYDGFMDTMDGLLSGRSRERMLEIMKDSRVGSYGALAAMCLLLFQWSLINELSLEQAMAGMFVMPVIGRMAMVMVIASFPYARPEGMGKAFSEMADKKTLLMAGAFTCIVVVPWGLVAISALVIGLLTAFCFGHQACSKLGGVTGDVYGAAELLTETAVLLVFFFSKLF